MRVLRWDISVWYFDDFCCVKMDEGEREAKSRDSFIGLFCDFLCWEI